MCNGTFHEKLQTQYKQMIVARQSLASVTAQCLEIGRQATTATKTMDVSVGTEEKDSFRWVVEVSMAYLLRGMNLFPMRLL